VRFRQTVHSERDIIPWLLWLLFARAPGGLWLHGGHSVDANGSTGLFLAFEQVRYSLFEGQSIEQ
jgi:hypothetical protein